METSTEGAHLAQHIERILNVFVQTWTDLDDQQLNTAPPFAPSNTIYQLAVHVAGSTRFWAITETGGEDFHRDRNSEFVAVGTGATIRDDYALLLDQVHTRLSALDTEALDAPTRSPSASFTYHAGPVSKRDAVCHVLEHTAIHLGHTQIQRQLLGLAPAIIE